MIADVGVTARPRQDLADLASAARRALQSGLDPAGVGDAGAAGLAAGELARVWAAVDASTAANTKAAYRSDWARFTAWCTQGGHAVLPADPLVVAAYVTEAAAARTVMGEWAYAPASLSRWVSSINQFHTAAHLDPPGRSEIVRRALSGIRRLRATPQRRRIPLLLDDIRTLVGSLAGDFGSWPAGVSARRDAALLLLGFTSACRRSELTAVRLADVTQQHPDGLHLRIRTSKTDQEGQGQVKAIPYGRDPATCPPCAYVRWRLLLDAADTDTRDPADRGAPGDSGGPRRAVMAELRRQADPAAGQGHVCRTDLPARPDAAEWTLFRTVHRIGRINPDPMSGHAVNQVIARRADYAGFTANQIARLGGHSLRAGFVTEAFRAGADAHAIMRQTGHRNPAQLETYAREHAPLVGNAVSKLGL